MTLSYDETTALTSLSWCNSRGVNLIRHCLYTMASGDSKFEADIESLIDDAVPRIYFVKSMINLLLTLKRIKFKTSILSGLPSI